MGLTKAKPTDDFGVAIIQPRRRSHPLTSIPKPQSPYKRVKWPNYPCKTYQSFQGYFSHCTVICMCYAGPNGSDSSQANANPSLPWEGQNWWQYEHSKVWGVWKSERWGRERMQAPTPMFWDAETSLIFILQRVRVVFFFAFAVCPL